MLLLHPMKAWVLCLLYLLLAGTKLPAQQQDMEQWLEGESPEQTAQRLQSLGVDKSAAEGLKQSQHKFVQWKHVQTATLKQFAVLFLPCASDTAYLYLLAEDEAQWRVIDQRQLDCHYDLNVSVEVASIHNSSMDEVMVHHACEGHGTGYLQQNFSVLAVVNGKFKTELETEEALNVSREGRPKYELTQHSTFTLVPAVQAHSRAIEETRSKTLNGKISVQRRIFRWHVTSGKYLPSEFVSVEANNQ